MSSEGTYGFPIPRHDNSLPAVIWTGRDERGRPARAVLTNNPMTARMQIRFESLEEDAMRDEFWEPFCGDDELAENVAISFMLLLEKPGDPS